MSHISFKERLLNFYRARPLAVFSVLVLLAAGGAVLGMILLVSIFERAFLMYYDHEDSVRQRQWSGWHAYIRDYCKRANFRDAWLDIGEQFDTDFHVFMAAELRSASAFMESSQV